MCTCMLCTCMLYMCLFLDGFKNEVNEKFIWSALKITVYMIKTYYTVYAVMAIESCGSKLRTHTRNSKQRTC